MTFLGYSDGIAEVNSLTAQQRVENAKNLNNIESLDDIYKTYRPMTREHFMRSSSTSTLKGGDENENAMETIECVQVQSTVAIMATNKAKQPQHEVCHKEKQEEIKTPLARKAAAPPTPPRPVRSSVPDSSKPTEELKQNNLNESNRDNVEIRIASGEMKEEPHGFEDQLENENEAPFAYRKTPSSKPPPAEQEMIASDYYAQQLAMQMSNPLYSCGGYDQSQMLAGSVEGYQFQSPDSGYFQYAQLREQMQALNNFAQYSGLGMSEGTNHGAHMPHPQLAGGGNGKNAECCSTTSSRGEKYAGCGECYPEAYNCSGERSGKSKKAALNMDNYNLFAATPPTGYSCGGFDQPCCAEDERLFGCGGQEEARQTRSKFNFVGLNPLNGMCPPMELPRFSPMANSCAMPYCMMPPTSYAPCAPMPACAPQCCQMPYCPAPTPAPAPAPTPPPVPVCVPVPPPAPTYPCCSPTSACCGCAGNCLNIEGFLQKVRAQQDCCYSNRLSSPPTVCCGDDRLHGQTVYAADYQTFCECGNNFNHFPHCGNVGSVSGSGARSSPICMPPLCCPPNCRAAPAACCPYEQPCCTMSMPSGCCAAPYSATCNNACYSPVFVPGLSPTTAPCAPCSDNC